MKDPVDWKWFGLVPILLAVAGALHAAVVKIKEAHEWWVGFVKKVDDTEADLKRHLEDMGPGLAKMSDVKENLARLQGRVDLMALDARNDKSELIDALQATEGRVTVALNAATGEIRNDLRAMTYGVHLPPKKDAKDV